MDEERNYNRKRSNFRDSYVDNDGSKRRNLTGQRDLPDLMTENTVYRYLCPNRKAGSIIGRGGEVAKHIRGDTGAKVEIEEAMHGCEERIVTISSSSKETNPFHYKKDYACPAQDALFKVHERLTEEEPSISNEYDDIGFFQVTARLLIPSDQARCIIGKQGHTIKNLRKDTHTRISIWNNDHILVCANSSEELLEINGEASAVKEALFQISCLLHKIPSRLHDHISSKVSYNPYSCHLRDPATTHNSQVEESFDFTLRLVCPSVNIREVIGKSGTNINQIRQESGATINLDCFFDEEDYMILISAKESIGNSTSPTTSAATQLLPGCSRRVESENAELSYVTRLLILRSQIGCLIGKGGSIIKDMRRTTHAHIFILEQSLPSVASADDAMIQISGDLPIVRNALIQVIDLLKANHFSKKGLIAAAPSTSSHYMSRSSNHGSVCTGRRFERHGQGYSHSSEYGTSVGRVPMEVDTGYGCSQVDGDK
ncbi:KH domain-containing protein [Platanthera guangdongensis]|uniref:KH domain-containing protein n=1 Tax=Platanthera guangdongensis TaxID=2320717 RepID=A0ABR2N3G8_9ASPA